MIVDRTGQVYRLSADTILYAVLLNKGTGIYADHGYCVIRTCPLDEVTHCAVKEGEPPRRFNGYVYLPGAIAADPQDTIQITASSAADVTQNNAKVQGSCYYTGSRPSEVGLLFGTDQNNLSVAATDQINHWKNPFDIWYDINAEAHITLSPGTTYYYQLYAIVGGSSFYSNTVSFTTPSAPDNTNVVVNATGAANVSAGNAILWGNCSYRGSRPSETGLLFGTDANSLTRVAYDRINHWKNPFDIWYNLNKEAGIYLNPGTTYYYQLYAVVDGQTVYSQTLNFTAK